MSGRDPYEDYVTINEEIKAYNEVLTKRPQIVVANKTDMPDSEETLNAFLEKLDDDNVTVYRLSTLNRQGLHALIETIVNELENAPEIDAFEKSEEEQEGVLYKYTKKKSRSLLHVMMRVRTCYLVKSLNVRLSCST